MKRLVIGVVLVWAVSGCAYVGQYRREYVAGHMQHFTPTIEGTALVITDPAQDEKLYSVQPSSVTGAATTFKARVGEFLRDVFVEVLSHQFTEGAEHAREFPLETHTYLVTVKPQLLTFDYRYNQLKNLGFLVTPEAKVSIQVTVADREGRTLFERTYDSDFVSGGSYMVDFQPAEKINRAVHRALVTLAEQVAKDIEQAL
jgi:hypothetical protein